MEGKFRVPVKPLEHRSIYRIEGFSGDVNWAPIMPRDTLASRTANIRFPVWRIGLKKFSEERASSFPTDEQSEAIFHRVITFINFSKPCNNLWYFYPRRLHTETSFRNLIKTSRNQIVFTMYRLIWNSKMTLSAYCSKSIGKW